MSGKSTYNKFCDENPEIKLTYVEYQNIIYGFNEYFRDYLLETGEKAKLPWGFGDFAVSKKKMKKFRKSKVDGRDLINLPVDWKKTKENGGQKIYHFNNDTEGFKFKFKWITLTARFLYSEVWSFKPTRITSRLLTFHLKKDASAQYKYNEWELRR